MRKNSLLPPGPLGMIGQLQTVPQGNVCLHQNVPKVLRLAWDALSLGVRVYGEFTQST